MNNRTYYRKVFVICVFLLAAVGVIGASRDDWRVRYESAAHWAQWFAGEWLAQVEANETLRAEQQLLIAALTASQERTQELESALTSSELREGALRAELAAANTAAARRERDALLVQAAAIGAQINDMGAQLSAARAERDAILAGVNALNAAAAQADERFPGREWHIGTCGSCLSMYPTLTERDATFQLLEPQPGEYGIGDIVIYPKVWSNGCAWPANPAAGGPGGGFVIHRIVDVDDGGNWIVRGDANGDWNDPCNVPPGKVLSLTVAIARGVFP